MQEWINGINWMPIILLLQALILGLSISDLIKSRKKNPNQDERKGCCS